VPRRANAKKNEKLLDKVKEKGIALAPIIIITTLKTRLYRHLYRVCTAIIDTSLLIILIIVIIMERSSSITWTSMQYVYFKMEKY